jgi:hypothetical protein
MNDALRAANSTPTDALEGRSAGGAAVERRHSYRVYGASVLSHVALGLPEDGVGDLAQVEVLTGPARLFARALASIDEDSGSHGWWRYAWLADGSFYARWESVGEFLVTPDGRRIHCRQDEAASDESFRVYLLGQALSFALVKQGFEPLHATAVAVDGAAVAFLGDSGSGKSTLASHFVAMGYRILTDDLLILQEADGLVMAYPGPSRIKLFPDGVPGVFADGADAVAMNPFTEKKILALGPDQKCNDALPLRGLYILTGQDGTGSADDIRIDGLAPREGFMALVGATYNSRVSRPARLRRQFVATGRLLASAGVRRLGFPRRVHLVPRICEAVLLDLAREEELEFGGQLTA